MRQECEFLQKDVQKNRSVLIGVLKDILRKYFRVTILTDQGARGRADGVWERFRETV